MFDISIVSNISYHKAMVLRHHLLVFLSSFNRIIVPGPLAGQVYFATKIPDYPDCLLYIFIHIFIVITCSYKGKKLEKFISGIKGFITRMDYSETRNTCMSALLLCFGSMLSHGEF